MHGPSLYLDPAYKFMGGGSVLVEVAGDLHCFGSSGEENVGRNIVKFLEGCDVVIGVNCTFKLESAYKIFVLNKPFPDPQKCSFRNCM